MNRRKTLVKYVVPAVLSSVSVFLFTIIDGIFVGRGVGTDALGSVNLAFPFVMIYGAFTMLSTIGGLTITSIRLGRGDVEGANRSFSLSAFMTLCICVVLCLVGTLLTSPVTRLLGANDTFFSMTRDYIFWYSVFIIPCGFGSIIIGFCRNDGDPLLVSIATIIATSLNIFGDWLCIFPLKMGLKGAAIATGISQCIAMLITLTHFLRKRGVLRFSLPRRDPGLLKKILIRGLPECVAQFCVPITTIVTNKVILNSLGDRHLNAYAVILYVAAFSASVFIGTSEGLQPLFGNCYGAGDEKGLKFYFRSGLRISFFGAAAVTAVILFLWKTVCSLFGLDTATTEIATAAVPRYAWGFCVQAVNVIVSAYLYSTTRSLQSFIINLLRSAVISVPVILLIPALFGSGAVWYTFGAYEGLVMIVAVILQRFADRNGAISGARE